MQPRKLPPVPLSRYGDWNQYGREQLEQTKKLGGNPWLKKKEEDYKRYYKNMQEIKPQETYHTSVENVEKLADDLHQHLHILEQRLSFMCRPAPEAVEAGRINEVNNYSPATLRMRGIESTLNNARRRIVDLLELLDA